MSFLVLKIQKEGYDKIINKLIDSKEKKILLYGAGIGFEEFIKIYPQFLNFNIVAISDRKFEKETTFHGIKAVPPAEINNQDFDMVIVTNEASQPIVKYLKETLGIKVDVKVLAEETIPQEREMLIYLDSLNFGKNLEKMSKKLKNKKVMFYGAGTFFQIIKEYYDLSKLNVIGIADKKYEVDKETKEFLGYKTFSPDEIKGAKPDYVIVSTLKFVNILTFLSCELLKKTKIKVVPFVKLPFVKLIKEIWNS